jgi:hypothetical protein
MPGSLSFGLNKTLQTSVVVTDIPTYKVINARAPIFDLSSNIVIGFLSVQKEILKANGNTIAAKYSHFVAFSPATKVKGALSFIIVYTADQLEPNGESALVGIYDGPVNSPVSSGVFLNENGITTQVIDSTTISKYYVNFPYGYANPFSITQVPSKVNNNEYVKIDAIDTPSWVIGSDPTELICVENGKWNILVQYQLFALKDGIAVFNGFFNVNGVDVTNSDGEQDTSYAGEASVLAIGYSNYYNKGDKVKFGVRSSNPDGSSELRVVAKDLTESTGINAPSVIVTASRLL